jgi:lipopolysaccharide biosynthesis regulator YciM
LSIYERSRDWAKASVIAQKLSDAGQGSFQGRQAHYLCEQAEGLDVQQHADQVIALLQQAVNVAPLAARARMALAKVYARQGVRRKPTAHSKPWRNKCQHRCHCSHPCWLNWRKR